MKVAVLCSSQEPLLEILYSPSECVYQWVWLCVLKRSSEVLSQSLSCPHVISQLSQQPTLWEDVKKWKSASFLIAHSWNTIILFLFLLFLWIVTRLCLVILTVAYESTLRRLMLHNLVPSQKFALATITIVICLGVAENAQKVEQGSRDKVLQDTLLILCPVSEWLQSGHGQYCPNHRTKSRKTTGPTNPVMTDGL